MTEGKLNDRIRKHCIDFKYKRYKNRTAISRFIWELHESKSTFQIKWDVLESKPAYKKGQQLCKLCVCKKKWIARLDVPESVNSNKEFVSKCPHNWNFRLARITDVETWTYQVIRSNQMLILYKLLISRSFRYQEDIE